MAGAEDRRGRGDRNQYAADWAGVGHRPHQALNDWTPRQVYLTSRESQ